MTLDPSYCPGYARGAGIAMPPITQRSLIRGRRGYVLTVRRRCSRRLHAERQAEFNRLRKS